MKTYVLISHFGNSRKASYRKVGFLYALSYLIDKKNIEKENLLGERIAGLKVVVFFVAEKWRKKTYVFISHSENSLYLFYPQSLINIKTL